MQRKNFYLFAFLLFALASVQSGLANPIFSLGNHPASDEQNILFSSNQTGSTITGVTNESDTLVNFASGADTLTASSNGQAEVKALDKRINDLTISLPGGGTYLDLILNPIGDNATVKVSVTTNEGSGDFSYTLGNGQNFLTITTSLAGEAILSTNISSYEGFEALKQARISGISSISDPPGGLTAVPEPTSLLLFGTGVLGIGLTAWRRRNK